MPTHDVAQSGTIGWMNSLLRSQLGKFLYGMAVLPFIAVYAEYSAGRSLAWWAWLLIVMWEVGIVCVMWRERLWPFND